MGLVLAAEEPALKRRVALKVMKPEVAAKEKNRQRFVREAQAAALVEHTHIVPIWQIGEANGVPFIAMPFLKGEPLDACLKNAKLNETTIINIGRQTAEGLVAAHEHGLIHRDIKPGNIWLETMDESTVRVKILDFGLARLARDEAKLSQSGAIMGTPAYMAPEQARSRPIDHRVDLFSLGCVLYECSTGKRPFTGTDTLGILSSLALDVPTEPHLVNKQISLPLSQLIMTLLEKDPAHRPASAREVVAALKKLQAETTIVVVTRSRASAPVDPWADIDASGASLVEFIPPASTPPDEAPAASETPASKRSKKTAPKPFSKKRLLMSGSALVAILLVVAGMLYFQPTEGVVRIESSEAGIEVVVDANGPPIKVGEPITLPAGEHFLVVKRGNLEFETGKFTLRERAATLAASDRGGEGPHPGRARQRSDRPPRVADRQKRIAEDRREGPSGRSRGMGSASGQPTRDRTGPRSGSSTQGAQSRLRRPAGPGHRRRRGDGAEFLDRGDNRHQRGPCPQGAGQVGLRRSVQRQAWQARDPGRLARHVFARAADRPHGSRRPDTARGNAAECPVLRLDQDQRPERAQGHGHG